MHRTQSYRSLFNGIEVSVKLSDGTEVVPINFDNAATTPPLKQVDAFVYDNILMYGSVGRGGHKSSYCTHAYELSRQEILSFFSLTEQDGYTVVYVKNTTEGLNFLANALCDGRRDKIITTRMEHHANDLPWRVSAHTFYIEVDQDGKLILSQLEEKLIQARGSIKYVTVTGAANVTGYINPIHKIASLVHRHGAMLIVDAAQLAAHREINMKGTQEDEAIDFLVFSGHKMYAPFGSGVIVGRKEVLDSKMPYMVGGGMVAQVLDDDVYWKVSPYKDEAGTPNFLGAMAIVAAMTVLKKIGFKNIAIHEEKLKKRLIKGLSQIPEVILYGDNTEEERLGVIPFDVKGIEHEKMAHLLQEVRGIAVRSGCFCAQPYVARLLRISDRERYQLMCYPNLPQPGMVRASLGLYNTEEEVDGFLNTIEDIIDCDGRRK